MPNAVFEELIQSLDSYEPRSIVFQKNIPVLAEAFHAEGMRQVLQEALFDPDNERYSISRCAPGKALYLPDHVINMQYTLSILDKTNGQTITTLANARLFEDLSSCETYLNTKLLPILARMDDRPEMKPFPHPVTIVKQLNMALSIFPIDGLIPTLVDATDPATIASLLAKTLPEALAGEFLIKDVQLLLAHYGRYERCVLRYSIAGVQAATQTPQSTTVYGKVDPDGSGSLTVSIVSALEERLREPKVPYRFRIPRILGYFPDLKLLLMEALPGKPFFKDLLKTWSEARGSTGANGNAAHEKEMTLEQAVRTCALIAATLHGSDIPLGPPKTLDMQVAQLKEETQKVGRSFPELHAQIESWIHETVAFSEAYPALPPCFSHGDFTYSQLIFDGRDGGLVDFDSICQAEAAHDLGHYLAYLKLNMVKNQDPELPIAPESIERLGSLFLDTYMDASRNWIGDEGRLRGRVAIYELISLIRLTLHSWEKMKGTRLKQTLVLLEERVERQRQISQSVKNKTQ